MIRKHDRAPYDIAPATNTAYAAMRQQRDDLLAALKAFVAAFDGDSFEEDLWPLMGQALAAIAKAEGKEV